MASSDKGERRTLGRGLSALMADLGAASAPDTAALTNVRNVDIDLVEPNPGQPRQKFDAGPLEELAASLREKGVLQPIIVRPSAVPGRFEIVAGERRWRAAGIAGLKAIPAIVRTFDDAEALQVSIIENVQRENLNAIEEATSYRRLIEQFGHTQEQVAEALGRSRSHVANLVRLLSLPAEVQDKVRDGSLSAGHARALIGTADPRALAREVVARSLSVRDTERLARQPSRDRGRSTARETKDADTRAIEGDLTATLRMHVSLSHGAAGEGGTLSIRYKTLDDLDFLCRVLAAASRDSLL